MTKPITLALAALALTLGACDSGSGSGPDGPARVTVMLTDNPGDVLNVWVEIKEVYLQGGPDGRTVLATFDPAEVVELTDLANAATELVSETEVPEGSYSELRFVLGGACLEAEVAGGGSAFYASDASLCPAGSAVTGTMQMPSMGQSGLKVKFDGALEFSGGPATLLVDFDVAESFGKLAGNSGKWVMHPVIKGATLKEAGFVKATLAPGTCAATGFKAELIAGGATDGEQRPFETVNGVLTALYKYTLPGAYTVELVAPTGVTTDPATVAPVPVTVTVGDTATAAFTLTSCTVAP